MSYWAERQKQLYRAMEKDEEQLKQRLSSFYHAEYAKLDREMAAFYAKYGKENVIEYRKVLERLSEGDRVLLMQRMEDFAKKYPAFANLMPVRENIYKLNRLEGLQYSIRMHQLEIGAVNQAEIAAYLNEQAQRGANAAMEVLGFGKQFYTENAEILRQFVNVPWSNGKNFSQRIWQNTDKLAEYLTTDLAQGFARGESYEKLTQSLRKRFEHVNKRDAYRLVYTEGTYVMAESTMQPFAEDFEYYRVSTVGDGKVCRICAGAAREKFRIADRQPGVNFPPFHAWCRCTFEIVVDDWDQWMDAYVKKHGTDGNHLKDLLNHGTICSNKTVISKDVIQNIKSFDLPELTAKENEELKKAMVKLLEKVQGTAQNTECASFYDIHMRFLKWEMGQPGKGGVKMYNPPFDYIALHNHPSGGTFSVKDIKQLVQNDKLQMMIVVGNNGKQYVLQKTNSFNGNALLKDYTDHLMNLTNKYNSLSKFLKESEEFLLHHGGKYGFKFKSID